MHNNELVELGNRIILCETVTPRIKCEFSNGTVLLYNGLVVRAYIKSEGQVIKITKLISELPKLVREYLYSCLRCWFMSADKFFDLPEIPEA